MKKRIIAVSLMVVVLFLLVWRFRPVVFSDIAISSDEIPYSYNLTCTLYEFGEKATYNFDSREIEIDIWNDVLEILNSSSYRQDFRNLLPWGVRSVNSDRNYDGRTALLSIILENPKKGYIHVEFISCSLMIVQRSGDNAAFRVYHPTNHKTIDMLIEYIQTYGVKQ